MGREGLKLGANGKGGNELCGPILRQKVGGGLIFLVHSVATINSAVITAGPVGCVMGYTHIHTHTHDAH